MDVGVLCRILYCLYCSLVFKCSFSGLITSTGEERDRAVFLLSITHKFVLSVHPIPLGALD